VALGQGFLRVLRFSLSTSFHHGSPYPRPLSPGRRTVSHVRYEQYERCLHTPLLKMHTIYFSETLVYTCITTQNYSIVGRLRPLAAGLSPRRPGFAPGSTHVGFVVDKVALGQVFLRVLRFSPVNIIPPSLSKLISSGECVIC
jgi:hypothetical protein